MISKFSLVAILMVASNLSHAGLLSGPESYEECITDSMKGVTSDVAAREIKRVCRSSFPYDGPKSRVASEDEVANISILTNVYCMKIFGCSVDVYNGNSSIAIRKLVIRQLDEQKGQYVDYSVTPIFSARHRGHTDIKPLTKGVVEVNPIEINDQYKLIPMSAEGY